VAPYEKAASQSDACRESILVGKPSCAISKTLAERLRRS
jgi:hypothetical protein